MAETIEFTLNGRRERVRAEPETPLLYVLRNDLNLSAPRFGCGLAQCGACTVHLDGTAIRSCATPVASARGAKVTTLEGLAASGKKPDGALHAVQQGNALHAVQQGNALHAVQQAFIDEQAAQCGYCINGWIMTAAALLDANPNATEEEIRRGLSGLKCRCGSHMSILRAVKLAASRMAAGHAPAEA
jgi:nicotinate dehydrogenase subunit A